MPKADAVTSDGILINDLFIFNGNIVRFSTHTQRERASENHVVLCRVHSY